MGEGRETQRRVCCFYFVYSNSNYILGALHAAYVNAFRRSPSLARRVVLIIILMTATEYGEARRRWEEK